MRYFMLLVALWGLGCDAWAVNAPPIERCAFVDHGVMVSGYVTDSVAVGWVGRADGTGRDTLWAAVCEGHR